MVKYEIYKHNIVLKNQPKANTNIIIETLVDSVSACLFLSLRLMSAT